MNLSIYEISNLESIYTVSLPEVYKKMLILIGEKIVKISLDNKTIFKIEKNIHKHKKIMPFVCDIQNDMMDMIKEIKPDTLSGRNIFFLTSCLKYDDIQSIAYFIEPKGENDCPVHSWIHDNAFDRDLIEIFSNGIEQWLYRINPALYIEWQARKIFCE